MRIGRIALRSAGLLLVLVVADRLLAGAVLSDGFFLGRPVAPFDPPIFSPAQRRALEKLEAGLAAGKPTGKFDPELGWCNKPDSGFGEFRYDWAGARIGLAPLAETKASGVRRVVALGCSMTHGEEVGATESWCARVDALEGGLEIANLAVAAYGIDQALMRLRRDGWKLEPDEVWLGVLPQAGLRVTTLFRPLLDHWSLDVAFKPGFRLGADGALALVPNPVRSTADIVRLLGDQRALLAALEGDPWVSRAPRAYAPRGSSWTHSSFVARLVLTAWERGGREFEACFDEEQEFGRLYTAIVRSMARECAEQRVVFRLLLLPGESDLRSRTEAGRGYWEDWAERLRGEGVDVVDLCPALSGPLAEGRVLFAPGGHYTAEASELVARALGATLAH
jgi:hypothetical protein